MKRACLFLFVILLMVSCSEQSSVNQPAVDKWNGYAKYLKSGEMVHTLWAGKNNNVGTVTYGLDDNANFYVTYNTTASGWTISETHNFAGDKILLPRNKPGDPKIGHFPNSGYHNPRVSTFTYLVPLTSLPPCEEPGFVVSSHCVVRSPAGKIETAWAEGDFKFTDKDWGWYDIYFYNQPANEFTILFGTAYSNDSLKLYHMDMTNGTSAIVLKEFVGSNAGRYDGTAYDVESGMFFFTNYNTNQLYVNNLSDEIPSFNSGTLSGKAASGTFYGGEFYYIDENENTINKVNFNTDWTIAGETVLDTIPGAIAINDIAMNLDGSTIFILGEVNGGGKELISWDVADETFYSRAITITSGAQIAFGSDGVLYAIAPVVEGGSHSLGYTVDPGSGTFTVIEDDVIIIDDPFGDISTGPIM